MLEPNSVERSLVDWAKGQPFNNVLILVLICLISWFGYYTLMIAVPIHLKSIQDGYERIQKVSDLRETAQRETFEKTLNLVLDKR